jgi:hypothetical protein
MASVASEWCSGVDLLAAKARGNRLLGQRLGRRLQLERDRDRPLIIDRDKDDGKLPDPNEVHRLEEVAFGARAPNRHTATRGSFLSLNAWATRAACLRGDRDAAGKIMSRAGRPIATFVAAPEQQDLLHLRAAPDQRSVVPVGRQQDILCAHRARNPDRDRLLTERDRIGAEPASALQRHRLEVEGARLNHGAVERNEQRGVSSESRQRPCDRAIWREVEAATGEIQFMGFLYPCIDQLVNHASRLRNRTHGRLTCPMVLRTPHGAGIRARLRHCRCSSGTYRRLTYSRLPCHQFHLPATFGRLPSRRESIWPSSSPWTNSKPIPLLR